MFQELKKHKVNKRCNCILCFVKNAMEQSNKSAEKVLECLRQLEKSGDIQILWDADGFPTDIERIASKRKIKRMLREVR